LLLSALGLILAIYIATQVLGVLYGIVFPPSAPLPAKAHEISHKNLAHGVDEWVYGTDQSGCEVLAYYQEHGGTCRVAPMNCGADIVADVNTPGQHVAICSGESQFSIFALRWEVNIATGYRANGLTQFNLMREIFWTGEVPRPTPTSSP
jgi:hypothetical protein